MKSQAVRLLAFAVIFVLLSAGFLLMSYHSKAAPLGGMIPSLAEAKIQEDNPPAEETPVKQLPETPEIDPYDEYLTQAEEILHAMTEEEKLYQLFFVTPDALTNTSGVNRAGNATQRAIETKPVGGLIYFAPNIQTPEQTKQMLSNTQSYSKIPLFLGVDEEGGRVSRISSNPKMGYEPFPPMGEIGGFGDEQIAYEAGHGIGKILVELGFNMNFAPVADVLISGDNREIGDRSFGSDPHLVTNMVRAITRGLRSTAVASAIKHFPGHGSTTADSHVGYSESHRTLEEMRNSEFLPFIGGIDEGTDFVLMSHMSAVNVDPSGLPASLSYYITTELLRNELDFRRIIITDALNMGAVTDHTDTGALDALLAGADMLLMPSDLDKAVDSLKQAIDEGQLSWRRVDRSVLRILLVKIERGIIGEDFNL